MQHQLKKMFGFGAVVALGIAAPVRFAPGTASVTVTSACAQETESTRSFVQDPDVDVSGGGGSCKPKDYWDCIIDGILRTNKCRAGDSGC